jgi:hypothetical protein
MSCSPLNQFGLLLFWLRCIEPPLALLQVEVEVGSRDAVETAHMTLGLIPEILDAVDMVLVKKGRQRPGRLQADFMAG